MTWLKQSTATDVELGPFVDSTDGVTAETGLTISQADCQLIKNGGAAAQKNDATSASHLAGGHYKVPLNTTDTNTLGRLRLYVNESGAVPVWRDFMVVPSNVWDSLFGADKLQVHADEITAGLITAAAIATGAIDADALATDAVTEIQGGLATAAALTTIDDFLDTEIAAILADTNELQTDWVNGGRLDLLIDAIKAKTDNLPSDPADDSDIDTQLATIAGYLDTEIAAIKAKTDLIPASPAAVGSAMTLSAGAITAAVIATDAIDSDAIAASAVTEIQSGLATAAGLSSSLAALNDLSAAEVNAEIVDALSTDTYAEPGSVPAATSSLKDKLGFIFAALRNKHQTTATTDAIRNDADSGDIGTATLSDSGTEFTRGEYV